MKALRAELFHNVAPFIVPMIGWHGENPSPPCTWAYIGCDHDNQVTRMCVGAPPPAPCPAGRSLPPLIAAAQSGCPTVLLREPPLVRPTSDPPPPARPPRPPLSARSRLWSGARDARAQAIAGTNRTWSMAGGGALGDHVRLPPQLAKLKRLEELELVQHFAPFQGGLPPEWLAPGAFPRLKR